MITSPDIGHSQTRQLLKMYGGAVKSQFDSLKDENPFVKYGTTAAGILATSPMLALALPVAILKDVTNPNSRTVKMFKTFVDATKAELQVRKDQDPVVKYGTAAAGILATSPMMAIALPLIAFRDISQ